MLGYPLKENSKNFVSGLLLGCKITHTLLKLLLCFAYQEE